MRVVPHGTGNAWLRAVADRLDPVTDGLALGRAKRLGDESVADDYLLTVHDADDALVAYAMRAPGRKLLVSEAGPAACEAVAAHLCSRVPHLLGVMGPERTTNRFAEMWTAQTGASVREGKPQRLFVLRTLNSPPQPKGRMRRASTQELDLLTEWTNAFQEETETEERGRDMGPAVRQMIEQGSLYVWDDDGPRCMAKHNLHGPRGERIGLVYTPPDLRGRGYASNLTGALTASLRDAGYKPITLFAQLDNPQSNRIYERLGYEPVQALGDWWFEYPRGGR